MKIKEFAIWKYGPLTGTTGMELGSFNLFFGPNEQGKTLTIDALVKILLGKNCKIYGGDLDRVEEIPEGYLIIERRNGQTIKLPESGDLTEVVGVTAGECRHVFIIRNSDLSINREGEFYKGVTNRLTGLRTEEIERITVKLQDMAALTPGNEFQDIKPKKLKSSLANAKLLVEQIRTFRADLEMIGYDHFETEWARIKGFVENTEQCLKGYEEARRREIYRKGSCALQIVKETRRKAAALRGFSGQEWEEWRTTRQKLESLQIKQRQIGEDLRSAQEKRQRDQREARRMEMAVQERERMADLFSEQVEPALDGYLRASRRLTAHNIFKESLLTSRALLFSFIFLAVSLAGAIARPSWWLNLFVFGALAFILLLGGLKFRLAKGKSRAEVLWQEIRVRAAGLGAVVENPEELLAWWGKFKRKLVQWKQDLNEAQNKVLLQDRWVERCRDDLGNLSDEIKQVGLIQGNFIQKTGVSSVEEYQDRLNIKTNLENQLQQQREVLKSHFGLKEHLSFSEQILAWQEELEALEPCVVLEGGLSYNEQEVVRLGRRREELGRRREKLEEQWGLHRKRFKDIEREVNALLSPDNGYLACQTLSDLEAAEDNLRRWIRFHDDNRRRAIIAIDLLARIKAGEEKKVQELFGGKDSVSRRFSDITGGRYTKVLFDSTRSRIMVEQAGRTAPLCANRLSGGAYDQLYFAIRFSLGEKLLSGETGFFILDDPFIKADPVRLKILLDMLLRAADCGWQILYFSAKGEVREMLREARQSGWVKEFYLR